MKLAWLSGHQLLDDGFVTVAVELKDTQPTSRGSQAPQAARMIELGYPRVPDPAVVWGSPAVEGDWKVLFNAGTTVAAGEFYSFGNFAGRTVDGSFFWRNPNTRSGVFAAGGNLLVGNLSGTGECPTVPIVDGLADPVLLEQVVADPNCFAFNEIFPGGFTPRFGGDVNDRSLIVGWRSGSVDEFSYDVSFSTGLSEASYRINNTVNASYGPRTPFNFNIGSQAQSENLVNLDFTTPIDVGVDSPLHMAFGLQYHREEFEIVAGDRASWAPGGLEEQGFSVGSNGFQGFSTEVAGIFSRSSYATYADVEVDVSDELLLTGALRYEDFSDFGGTLNGKISGRLEVSPTVALRASASTGFRAPSIGQLSLRRVATTFSGGMLAESVTLPPTHPVAVLKGGRPLEPEESTNWNLGAVMSSGNATYSVDWFRIAVDHRIALTQQSLSEADRKALLDRNLQGAGGTIALVSFFVNDISTETWGIDLTASSDWDWNGGRLVLTAAYNFTNVDVTDQGVTLSDVGVEELEDALPATRVTFTVGYDRTNWRGTVRTNYYGEVFELLFNDEGLGFRTDSLVVLDAAVSRPVGSHTLTFGIDNVFDIQPDRHPFADMSGFAGSELPNGHPAGYNGAGYYVLLTSEF